jgi:pimeloyl-ACP methyl ester carboxylesterase
MCSKSQMGFCQVSVQQRQIGEHLDGNRAFTTADFRTELPKIMVPTLNIQGDADLSAPIGLTGKKTAWVSAAHFRIVSSRCTKVRRTVSFSRIWIS